MSTQLFPARRDDGSAEVAAVFAKPFDQAQVAITAALADWRELVEGTNVFEDLDGEPRFESSEEGFRIVFEIQPGSTHWKGWAVALLRSIEDGIGGESFVGFFDVVRGQMHQASRREPLDG